MNYDLVIIGSGPAGLSAGIQAAEAGASVIIVDENPVAGGKLLGQLHEEPNNGWWIGQQMAKQLAEKAKRLGVDFLQEREVWGIFPNWTIKLNKGEELTAYYVLIAAGAAEKAMPIPGWTIPGVMAIGAAQVMNNYQRVKPGNKAAVIGMDPLALTVSRELKMAGSDVAGIFLPPMNEFSNEKSNPKHMISYLSGMSHLAPTPLLKMAGKLAKREFIQKIGARMFPANGVKVWDIPLFLRKTVVEIEGKNQVERIIVADVQADGSTQSNSFQEVDVDCVCISGGLYPLSELAAASGCQMAYIEELGGHVPLYSPEMETTQKGIFVAGNITGIEGAKIAMAQGELAGIAICSRLGCTTSSLVKEAQEKVKEARQHAVLTFQPDIEQGRKRMEQLWEEYSPVHP